MKHKKSILKQLGAALLALAIVITGMPPGAMFADAASSGPNLNKSAKFSYDQKLKDGGGNYYSYPASEQKYMQIHLVDFNIMSLTRASAAERPYLEEYRILQGSNKYVAYCLEHGVRVDESMALHSADEGESYIEQTYINEGKQYVMMNMGLCLFYGRRDGSSIYNLLDSQTDGGLGFRDSKYYVSGTKYRLSDWEAATRQLIHESQQLFRDENFKLVGTSLKYQDAWKGNTLGTINKYHYRTAIDGQPAEHIYDYMVTLIQDHYKFSSNIASRNKNNAKEIQLTDEDGDGVWTAKVYVSEERAYALDVIKGKGHKNVGITLTKEDGKNYYLISYTGQPDTETVYTVKKYIQEISDVDSLIIWQCKDGVGHVQTVATGASDPVEAYLKFTTKEVTDTLDEPTEAAPPEPEYFPTFEFPVAKDDLNPGWDGDTSTPMGDATLAATYILYRDGTEVDRVTLNEYGETAVLSDQPWVTAEDLMRTESGTTALHMVEGSDGESTEHGCGIKEPTKVEWEGSHEYKIVEVRPDGRFIEPDAYGGVREYSVSYYAVTKDSRSYACEDSAWSDIQYEVNYNVTTGENNPGTGNGNGTIDEVDVSLSFGEQLFINDNFRGKLTISKSLENEDIFNDNAGGTGGGQKDSTKSLWRIRLASGGYEGQPYIRFVKNDSLSDGTAYYTVTRDASGSSNETEYLKIGSNGDLLVTDLPYGEYIVEEYAADDVSYVKEQFSVSIGEYAKYVEKGGIYTAKDTNDNRYDYNLRDKKIENVIKIVKTDAETGKQVTATGTKFYIVYKGNPLLSEAERKQQDTYNRYLPNAEDIYADGPYTFEADENGEIAIPYELEWGEYEIQEWKLPDGYFVGKYGEDGKAVSHNYGKVEEGQRTVLAGSSYTDLVAIYDSQGKKVEYQQSSEYEVNEVFNFYTFRVEKQETHVDGNVGQMVDSDGNISSADPNYDQSDYPYIAYYKAVSMANNQVKGKIEIEKTGEVLSGFQETVIRGKKVMQPVYETVENLKDAVFGIFAAADIWLSDGNEGPVIYDSVTEEEILIPKTVSTHAKSLYETVKSILSKFFAGEGDVYETGELLHSSGAKLWYLKDRSVSENGRYTRVYVSPEQKDTSYHYSYETEEGNLNYRYDVEVLMNHQAGGRNITDVKVTKTTSVAGGYLPEIPLTVPTGSVGETELNPIETFMGSIAPDDTSEVSRLSVHDQVFTYEADGNIEKNWNDENTDFGAIGVKRYLEEQTDAETQPYTVPDGWILLQLNEDTTENMHYVMAEKEGEYIILLEDRITWQACDAAGNFEKMTVQVYEASYTQVAGSEDGFTFSWDGFHVDAKSGVTKITAQDSSIEAVKDVGAGFTFTEEATETVFTASEPQAPVYLMGSDGIKTEMYYAGGTMKATITVPQSAVDKDYEYIVPTLNFISVEEDEELGKIQTPQIINWYENLTPANPVDSGSPAPGITWTATRHESENTGEAEYYTIEIVSNQIEDAPMQIAFADGYTATMYAATAESGNGVGVIVLDSIYNTNRHSLSELVQTLTTGEDGKAASDLLPLGTYIVRELTAPSGYVTEDTSQVVKLEYKDQFTPLIWNGVKANNEAVPVEIDLEKVFETAYQSGKYAGNGGAVFGLYSAEKLTSSVSPEKLTDKLKAALTGSIEADTLMDVIQTDSNGKALSEMKLPAGKYYIKELSNASGYKLNDTPFYFVVGETEHTVSQDVSFAYNSDGIRGNVIMDSYGKATITVQVLTRTPMPKLSVNEKSYDLTQDMANSQLTVDVDEDMATVKIAAEDGKKTEVTLPNGKIVAIQVNDNTFDYIIDDISGSFVPTVSYTGYFAKYVMPEDVDSMPEPQVLTFTGAGGSANAVTAERVYTPKMQEVEKDGQIVMEPVLDQDGKQVYEQTLSVDIIDKAGDSLLTEKHSMAKGDAWNYEDSNGTSYAVSSSKDGNIIVTMAGYLAGTITDEMSPKATVNGSDMSDKVDFAKSVTLARQNHAAGTLQIKVNTLDNLNAGAIKNDRLDTPPDVPVITVPDGNRGVIEITKSDMETGETLPGAEFEIWDAKPDEEGNPVPDKVIYTGVTGEDGKMTVTVDYGIYFYHETKAPAGYLVDGEYYMVEVSSGKVIARVTMDNEKIPEEEIEEPMKEKPDKPKPQKPQKTTEVPKTGDNANVTGYFILAAVSLGVAICLYMRKKK